jgi:hypothetical protein
MPHRVRPNQTGLRKRVLDIVRKQKMCDLDELILECTSYNWTYVFLEVDRLSRSGELRLLHRESGEYTVTLPRAA